MSDGFGPAGERPHRRILASAGCGKTFALSSRFLELVHRGEAPAAVLASTFSRAAAAEIRDRVLQRAAKAVLDDGDRAELAASIGDPDFDAAAAEELLGRLIAALPGLQIRTIDSLFASVTIAFAAELDLPPEPRVLDEGEGDSVLRAAIQQALAEMGEEDALATLASLARGERQAAVVPAVERAVGGLVALLLDSAEGAWDWPEPPAPSADAFRQAAEELLGLAERCDKKGLAKGIRADVERFEDAFEAGGDSWADALTVGPVKAIVAGESKYSRAEISDELRAAYAPLIEFARDGARRTYARMTHATRDLLTVVSARLAAEKKRRGVVSFEDLTRVLDPARGDELALDEIWFRLDARVRHLLLDEFQDTSAAQWRALRPIAGEIGAHGDGSSSLFAVGDLKQSIYGWRGGEPGILEDLARVTIDGGEVGFWTQPLVKSFRSALPVIEAVNAVFASIAGNQRVIDESEAAAERFGEWFEEHDTARRDLTGFARFLELPPPEDGEKAVDVGVRAAVAAAQAHWERLRGTGARIAVLVRRNALVGRIVARLKQAGVPASGRGGGSLFDAEATLATIQALQLAERPDDTVAAFDLAHSPLAPLVGFGPGVAPLRAEDRRRVSTGLRVAMARRGVAALVDGWRRALDQRLNAREVVRMRQLVEAIARLEIAADRSPGELVGLLRAARVDDPGGEGVTVLNVHQSKGLEYDVVIVTDLGKALGVSGSREKVAFSSPERPAALVPRVTRWVREALHWPEVVPLHRDVQTRAVLESLCVLYVALTRAKRGLEVHVDPVVVVKSGEESATSRRSASALLRAALDGTDGVDAAGVDTADGHVELWACGEVADLEMPRLPIEVPGEGAVVAVQRLRVGVPAGARRARRARSASADGGEAERRRFLFEAPDPEASDRGRALHACFEVVEWLDDGPSEDAALDLAVRRAAPGRAATWRAERVAEFRAALGRDAIRAVLRRPGTDAEVRCEHRFVRVTDAGIQEGSIDRLLLRRDVDGRVTSAVVFDFKTGSTADPGELARRHAAQLRAYRDVVVEQYGLDPDAVAMQVVAVEAGVVADVSDA